MKNTEPLVLVMEDERDIRRFVRQALESEQCRVFEASTLAQAGTQVRDDSGNGKPDLVVLDLGLPDGDGVGFIRALRAWSSLPVLVLSARSNERDKIGALDAGADDYLTKPFSIGELLARVRALLRRSRHDVDDDSPSVNFGDVEVDLAARIVRRSGSDVHLTQIEYQLLCVLIAHAGKVLTHRTLLRDVWGTAFGDNTHYLRIYVGNLRRKLESDPAQPRHFLTETGVGYRFVL
jgi:two-component system KDP operon response regulator KdpE